jgi:SAM-dependent methyltransferase
MGTAPTQAALWGRGAEVWSTTMEQAVRPFYLATLAALAPLQGLDLLDAGCGSGQLLADAAAAGARVSGLDATPELLEITRRRVPSAQLQVGDIQELPYPDGSFDVVTAFNSIQFAADPAAAVRELARVCRAGGRVALGMWGEPQRCETERLFGRLRSLAPPPPGAPAPLALSDPGVVEELLTQASLTVSAGAEIPIAISFPTLDDAWRAHASAGPVQKVMEVAGPDAVRGVVDDVLTADRKPDGAYRQDNVMRYVIAGKD